MGAGLAWAAFAGVAIYCSSVIQPSLGHTLTVKAFIITVLAGVVSLLVGTTVLMASLAFSFQRYFEYQIEEARKISQ